MSEQIVHFLKWQFRRLGKEHVEEECIGEVTDDEQEVISVANVLHCGGSYLTN